jgi:hypothetical protein
MFLTLLSLRILFFFFMENNGTARLYIKKELIKSNIEKVNRIRNKDIYNVKIKIFLLPFFNVNKLIFAH